MYSQSMGAEHIARAGLHGGMNQSRHGNHRLKYNGWDLL